MTQRRSVLSLVALCAVFAVSTGVPATAAGPPKGNYWCPDLDPYWFKLKSENKYTDQTGDGGKWKYNKGASHEVKFKNGPLDYAYGKFRRTESNQPVIDLYDRSDDSLLDECPKN